GKAAAADTIAGRTPNYDRGYASIAALFPFGGYSGNFNLQNTYVRTEQGGDINVLGPGGDFFLGAVTGAADTFPDRVGVLTLNYGSISIFARDDVQVGQSRVFTVDGGDILIWSSTGDINAGLGSRTARFVPPLNVIYNPDGTFVPNPAGTVTGSGIATFTPFTPLDQVASLAVPPQTPAEAHAQQEEITRRTSPSINLVAPVGAVDFGDAGVRSAGNLNVAALTVVNALNVQVAGTSTGVPQLRGVNVTAQVSAASTANQAAGAAQQVARQSSQQAGQPQQQSSVVIVQVLGFGGTAADATGLQ
ncbi:MAG TPA: filamentous hemagglutinin family protein, partial [Crenalkalicoccus sp.]|nr:filamentous hemagglutinin family protein [Crenalkalicoccus sp.]